jgi:hypothetical protein
LGAGRANSLPVAHTASGSSRHYPKGSFVLDMLRNELGNDHYRKSIAFYLNRFYHQNVETSDLVASIYEATGRNVKWFFDQWIHRGGEPVIDFNYTIDGKNLKATTQQIHNMDATVGNFRLPMKLSIYYVNGTIQHVPATLSNTMDTFFVPLEQNAAVSFVLLDENMQFLRKIKYSYDTKTLLAIAEKSQTTFGRLEAIENLKDVAWVEKNKTLVNVYHKETSSLVKNEITEQVAKSNGDEFAKDILMHSLTDAHVQIRRNAIKSVHFNDETLKKMLIDRLNDSSYVNVENAVNKLIELYPTEKMTWLKSIENQTGIMNNLIYLYHSNILADSSLKEKHPGSKDKMKFLASQSNEFRSRVPAITFLMEHDIMDIDITKSMIQGALYFHPGIRGNSIEFLKKIKTKQPKIYGEAIRDYPFAEPNMTLKKLESLINAK